MTRISREAPVPIVEVFEKEDRAGSAASPAANVIALGSQASVVGVIGCDPAGVRLEDKLRQQGIDDHGLLRWHGVATSTKTRILAQGYTGGLHGRQQVMRLDDCGTLRPEAAHHRAQRGRFRAVVPVPADVAAEDVLFLEVHQAFGALASS